MLLSSKMRVGLTVTGLIAALVLACGSEAGSEFDANGEPPGDTPSGSFGSSDEGPPDEDLYAKDPPPKWCGPGDDPAPPEPGGTEECPDDKNKPGCSCTKLGEKAACWTGLRKHRNLGICKEGQTTCIQKDETSLQWGPCEGEVLPVSGATKGKEACGCFSVGQWKLANLAPCLATFTDQNGTVVNAVSTIPDGDTAKCPEQNPPTAPPAQAWSTNTLNVDCAGHFKLCLRIKQGDFDKPSANDCVLAEVCAESDYKTANVEQEWPALPGWLGKDPACAKKWSEVPETKSSGYAEMIVKGQSVRCDAIDDGNGGDLVFNRVKYCPRICNEAANANLPECVSCQQSGQGQF